MCRRVVDDKAVISSYPYVPGGGGRGALKGLQFSKRLDFGGSILKMHKM